MRPDDESLAGHDDTDAEVGRNHREKEPETQVRKSSGDSEPVRQTGRAVRKAENAPEATGDKRKNYVDLTKLIRSIQRSEDHRDCFRALDFCEEMDCRWRPYCLDQPTAVP